MLRHPQMLGLLRGSMRPASTRPLTLVRHHPTCQLSTFRSTQLRHAGFVWERSHSRHFLVPSNSRNFTLGSIFSRKSTPLPTPLVVAHITRLEADANTHPRDVEKQLALFQALLETKLKTSYDLVINRWERMCEFDPSSPVLHSQDAFKLYLRCLLLTNQRLAIDAAVRRRDTLLAAHPLLAAANSASVGATQGTSQATAIPTLQSTEPSSTSTEAAPMEPGSAPAQASEQSVSPSQQAAQSVLENQLAEPVPSSSENMSQFAKLKNWTASGTQGSPNPPIQVSIVERKGAWVPRLVRFLVLVLVSSFFFLVILAVFFENTGIVKNGPQQSQFEPAESKTVKFSDVHGVDEVKDELQDIVAFLKNPGTFTALGGKLPKGVLLTGPPGTGKTLLARAVAGEAGVPFFFASGSDFEEIFVGMGAKRVRELFAAARKKEPAIIFIDELDAVGGKRSTRDVQYIRQTLNQLLVEMDGFQANESIIVIAATNFPESLDQALVRPGRFDRIVAVPLPDIRGRFQILKHHMRGVTISEDIDPHILARGTSGFSGADLANMVNLAAIQASKEHAKEVDLKHFEWAKDRIVMGAERKSQFIDQKEKLATAYHEGGHTLVALYTEGAMPLHKVTCIPRGHALGYTSLLPENDQTSTSYKEYLARIDVMMGGRVAEEIIYGRNNVSSGASSDIQKATQTATAMVKRWGFSKLGPVFYDTRGEDLSQSLKEDLEEEIAALVRGGVTRATAILNSRLEELHRLAHALVEYETLDADEVRKVIKGEPIRKLSEVLEESMPKVNPPAESTTPDSARSSGS